MVRWNLMDGLETKCKSKIVNKRKKFKGIVY